MVRKEEINGNESSKKRRVISHDRDQSWFLKNKMQYFTDVLMVGQEARYSKSTHPGTLSYKELANICHNLTLFSPS